MKNITNVPMAWLALLLITVASHYYAVAQVKTYSPPQLSHPDSWSMVMIPDPQTYVKFQRNQPVFELMTAWVADNVEKLDINMVLCTGDLVEQNDLLNPDGRNGDQPSKTQWEQVSHAFERLDGKVPYISATGNHDFGVKNIEYRRSNYDRYFPVDKNPASQRLLREVGIDYEGFPTLTNAAYEFTTKQETKFLVLVIEFAPRDTVLSWALEIVNKQVYENHNVILLTHSFLNSNSEHIAQENYPVTDGNYGENIWKKLVKPAKNIRIVLSGHIGKADDVLGHIGFREDVNDAGLSVHQMVFNAQALGGGWHGNGGDGWLRIMEFLPDGKTVRIKTFSPLFAISPSTQHLAWRTEGYDEFEFRLD